MATPSTIKRDFINNFYMKILNENTFHLLGIKWRSQIWRDKKTDLRFFW